MLRIHSFLQETYGSLKLSLTKKMYRNCVIFVSGTALVTVITFSSHSLGESSKNQTAEYQSQRAVLEEGVDEEIYVETKAKVQTADSLAEIETQQISLENILEEERMVSEKEKNPLSAVTQGQDEIIQQEEYNRVSEGTIDLVSQEEVQKEAPETIEVLVTDNGKVAGYNEFMASVTLTEQEKSYLLHLVAAEAGGCDMVGQILVANVVLNRMESSAFPNTVEGVIFQKNQFSPAMNGVIWSSTITDSVREAVERALNGEDFSEGATFFSARARLDYSSMSWFDNNLNWLFKHDGHEFYSLK